MPAAHACWERRGERRARERAAKGRTCEYFLASLAVNVSILCGFYFNDLPYFVESIFIDTDGPKHSMELYSSGRFSGVFHNSNMT